MSEELTYAQVSKHNTKKDLYVVIHDKVYNASTFVDEHPYVILCFHCSPMHSCISHCWWPHIAIDI